MAPQTFQTCFSDTFSRHVRPTAGPRRTKRPCRRPRMEKRNVQLNGSQSRSQSNIGLWDLHGYWVNTRKLGLNRTAKHGEVKLFQIYQVLGLEVWISGPICHLLRRCTCLLLLLLLVSNVCEALASSGGTDFAISEVPYAATGEEPAMVNRHGASCSSGVQWKKVNLKQLLHSQLGIPIH